MPVMDGMEYSDNLKLYIYRLKLPGDKEIIQYSLPADQIREPGEETLFASPISVDGSLERIDHDVWGLFLNVTTDLGVRCCVCNEVFSHHVAIKNMSHFIHYEENKSGVFDCKELIRQELLLECDRFLECQNDGCPKRGGMSDFLRKKSSIQGNNPFECL